MDNSFQLRRCRSRSVVDGGADNSFSELPDLGKTATTGVNGLSSPQVDDGVGHMTGFSVGKSLVTIFIVHGSKVPDETHPTPEESLARPHLILSAIGTDFSGSDSHSRVFLTVLVISAHKHKFVYFPLAEYLLFGLTRARRSRSRSIVDGVVDNRVSGLLDLGTRASSLSGCSLADDVALSISICNTKITVR